MFPELAVGEIQVPVPVVGGHVVFTRTDVIRHGIAHGLVQAGHPARADPALAQQGIDRAGFGPRIGCDILASQP